MVEGESTDNDIIALGLFPIHQGMIRLKSYLWKVEMRGAVL